MRTLPYTMISDQAAQAPTGDDIASVGEPAPKALLWVDPAKINLVCSGAETRGELLSQTNAVLDGDWDRATSEFGDLDLSLAVRQRFREGAAWEETGFYRRVCSEIAAGRSRWGCASEEALRRRLETDVDGLYGAISSGGYATQEQLGREPLRDEIAVAIGREGRFRFVDGKHRLAIARCLGLPAVPVRVTARHSEWCERRRELAEFAATQLRGKIYQAIDHPDLADFPAHKGHERAQMVRAALSEHEPAGRRLLDIGTQWGYMAQQMDKLGFSCVGVEASGANLRFARMIQEATEGGYEIWAGRIYDYPGVESMDVVLALNIFHHLIKTRELHDGLIALLRRMRAEVMIFEPHVPELAWRQMQGAYRNYEPDEFVAFVAEHAGMGSIERLGVADDGRPMYKLTR